MNNTSKTAVEALTKTIDSYRIKDGIPQGLIDQADIDQAIIDALVAYGKKDVPDSKTLENLKTSDIFNRVYNELVKSLRDQVWNGKIVTKKNQTEETDNEGNTVTKIKKSQTPVTISPRFGINYRDLIFSDVQSRLLAEYRPHTPVLEHEADIKRFLTICRDLFPNVAKPVACATAFRDLIENIHNSCNTANAKFVQKAMWLYSLKTGGTGKSYFLHLLKCACDRMGIDAAYENFKESNFLAPTVGLHTLTISEDTPKLDSSMAETLNTIIDRSTFKYNIKYGASGLATSVANLVLASNYISFESNTRRYNQVEYVQYNLTSALTKSDREKYFPLWNDEEKGIELIIEAFTVAPFKCEYPDFDIDQTMDYEVDDRYISTLLAIQETVAKRNEFNVSVNHMRPTEFARCMAAELTGNYRDYLGAIRNFLTELKSNGKLPTRDCAGRSKIDYHYFDWVKIAGITCNEEDGNDFLESIHNEWNELIARISE